MSGSKRSKNQQAGPEKRAIKRDQRAIARDQAAQASLHDMGGNIGPASIRGSAVAPGGQREHQAEPESGYSTSTGYTAVRDDDWQVTAGADKVWTGEPDEQDTFGPSPVAVPQQPGGPSGESGQPGFRVRGPVDEAEYGLIDDADPAPDDPDADSGVTASLMPDGGHVTAGLRWSDGDSDSDDGDPDIGSGRTWE